MQLVLRQTFPLGRFHATPWKAFPYDDPHGEWPPSPWRLVRAVLARSYQLGRELPGAACEQLRPLREALVHAFATSELAWKLPAFTWRGPGLRQYHPAEFKRVPASAKLPGMMAYNTTKVLDNFWLTAGDGAGDNQHEAAVWWLMDGAHWTPELLEHLDACLARMTYFGRAESITEIHRVPDAPAFPANGISRLLIQRTGSAAPVLTLKPDATLLQVEASTDEPAVAEATIPPGSRWMFVERPKRPHARTPAQPRVELPPTSLVQFALGSNVAPRYRDAVRLTERFRARVLGSFTHLLTGDAKAMWNDAPEEVRAQTLLLSGRNADRKPLEGHRHAFFLLHGEPDKPTRLCVWRSELFTDLEQRAILAAAQTPLPLTYKGDPWTVNLVPLDKLVSPPPGFGGIPSRKWKSLTPYVPPRHVYDRRGRLKPGDAVSDQLSEELTLRGCNTAGLGCEVAKAGWVKTHQPSRSRDKASNTDKLGYAVTLTFSEPVPGPFVLGQSCHFGLGLFVPAGDEKQ
jgi:CRISPR-associated protein Csb2